MSSSHDVSPEQAGRSGPSPEIEELPAWVEQLDTTELVQTLPFLLEVTVEDMNCMRANCHPPTDEIFSVYNAVACSFRRLLPHARHVSVTLTPRGPRAVINDIAFYLGEDIEIWLTKALTSGSVEPTHWMIQIPCQLLPIRTFDPSEIRTAG